MDSWIVLTMIAAYFVVTTGVGIAMARRSRGGDDWAIAGRGMGLGLLVCGIAATRVGGVSTYGVAGDVISGGVWNLWYAAGAAAAMAVLALFFARPYRCLGLQTVGEIFYARFQTRRCQSLASLCVQTEFAIINIIEPYIVGRIMATVTGLPFGASMACAAVVLISYPAFGGLWGSAATNVIHAAAIFAGLTAVGTAGLLYLGGWSAIVSGVNTTLTTAGIDAATWWDPVGAGWLAVVGMMLAAVIHTPAVSVWVNFASAAREEKSVVPAFMIGGLMAAVGSLLAGLIGIETLAKYGAAARVANYETLTRLASEINPWLGGLAIAAVLAAVISSGGPLLLASATMFVRDWVPASAKWSQGRRLRAFRTTTIVYGTLGAAIAWLGPIRSILDLLLFAFAMVIPTGVAVAYVLYLKRTTEAGVFWGICLGYCAGLAWFGIAHAATRFSLAPSVETGAWRQIAYFLFVEGGGIDPSYAATLIPVVVIPLVSFLTVENVQARDSFYKALNCADTGAALSAPAKSTL